MNAPLVSIMSNVKLILGNRQCLQHMEKTISRDSVGPAQYIKLNAKRVKVDIGSF